MEQAATKSDSVVFGKEESKYRLLQENFLKPKECQTLINLVENQGQVGDGYQGNPHPHTTSEIFGGYSFEGIKGVKPDITPEHLAALSYMLRARDLLKSHFNLPFLWLVYGHLVFREPVAVIRIERRREAA